MRCGTALLGATARRLAIDLLSAIDAAQCRWPVAAAKRATVLHPLPALPDVGALGLPDVGSLALADAGSLRLADIGAAVARPVGQLATELLALLGPGTLLTELLPRRPITVGDA